MKFLVLTLTLLQSTYSSGACNVQNYYEARSCVYQDAQARFGTGKVPHSVGATRRQNGKDLFEMITQESANSEYVLVVQNHDQPNQLHYYKLERGQNVKPELVKSLDLNKFNSSQIGSYSTAGKKETLKALSLRIPLVGSMKSFHLN